MKCLPEANRLCRSSTITLKLKQDLSNALSKLTRDMKRLVQSSRATLPSAKDTLPTRSLVGTWACRRGVITTGWRRRVSSCVIWLSRWGRSLGVRRRLGRSWGCIRASKNSILLEMAFTTPSNLLLTIWLSAMALTMQTQPSVVILSANGTSRSSKSTNT